MMPRRIERRDAPRTFLQPICRKAVRLPAAFFLHSDVGLPVPVEMMDPGVRCIQERSVHSACFFRQTQTFPEPFVFSSVHPPIIRRENGLFDEHIRDLGQIARIDPHVAVDLEPEVAESLLFVVNRMGIQDRRDAVDPKFQIRTPVCETFRKHSIPRGKFPASPVDPLFTGVFHEPLVKKLSAHRIRLVHVDQNAGLFLKITDHVVIVSGADVSE